LQGWVAEELGGGILFLTRFAETPQVHHVQGAGMYRKQVSFFLDAVAKAIVCPSYEIFPGFAFLKDTGGNEFYQIYLFNQKTGSIQMITDGKSRNDYFNWNNKGDRFVFSSTRRNGKNWDIIISDRNNFGNLLPLLEREQEGYCMFQSMKLICSSWMWIPKC